MTRAAEHTCFGCGKRIADYEPHIHAGLDATLDDLPPLGLDDILTFAYCLDCTQDGGKFIPETHEIEEAS